MQRSNPLQMSDKLKNILENSQKELEEYQQTKKAKERQEKEYRNQFKKKATELFIEEMKKLNKINKQLENLNKTDITNNLEKQRLYKSLSRKQNKLSSLNKRITWIKNKTNVLIREENEKYNVSFDDAKIEEVFQKVLQNMKNAHYDFKPNTYAYDYSSNLKNDLDTFDEYLSVYINNQYPSPYQIDDSSIDEIKKQFKRFRLEYYKFDNVKKKKNIEHIIKSYIEKFNKSKNINIDEDRINELDTFVLQQLNRYQELSFNIEEFIEYFVINSQNFISFKDFEKGYILKSLIEKDSDRKKKSQSAIDFEKLLRSNSDDDSDERDESDEVNSIDLSSSNNEMHDERNNQMKLLILTKDTFSCGFYF